MPSHSVRPAGKRYSRDEYVGGADAHPGWLPATDARDRARRFRVGVPTAAALEAASPLGTSRLYELPCDARAPRGTAAAPGRNWRARQAGASAATAGPAALVGMIPRSLRRSRPRGGRRALDGAPAPVRGRAGINRHANAVSCVAARRSRGMSALVIKNPRSRMTSFPSGWL